MSSPFCGPIAPNIIAQLSISVLPTSSSCVPVMFEQRVGVAGLELRHEPAIEVELRLEVLGRAGEVRHAAARDDRDAFLAALDDLGDRLAERRAALGRRQRRHVDVGEERDDRDVALADDVFERHREGVARARRPPNRTMSKLWSTTSLFRMSSAISRWIGMIALASREPRDARCCRRRSRTSGRS